LQSVYEDLKAYLYQCLIIEQRNDNLISWLMSTDN